LRALARSGRAGRVGSAATALAALAAATGFLSLTGLFVTIGGTLGVAWITFPRTRLESTWRLLEGALSEAPDPRELVTVFRRLARIHRLDGPRGLERAAVSMEDSFLRRALVLALECTDATELEDLLVGEARGRAAEGEAARHVLATLGKLFPAFGLIGTLIGLALLLRNLGGTDVSAIGPGLAIAVLILAWLPVMIFVRDPVRDTGSGRAVTGSADVLPGMEAKAALRTGNFWTLSIAFVLGVLAINGTITHMVALLTDRGIPLQTATGALSVVGIALIVGRIICGWCLDRFWGPYVAACFFVLPV